MRLVYATIYYDFLNKKVIRLRVIAGCEKGRILKPVPGKNTRPTTDKVKEALFSMLTPYLNGGMVLDLFAGTGGLGIEALSRGMDHSIFVDYDRNSFEVIKYNVEACGFSDQSEIYKNDAERALKALVKRKIKFDVVFLDPPYKLSKIEKIIGYLALNHMVDKDGIIVVEHDVNLQLPVNIESFNVVKMATYGITGITIYKLIEEE